MTSVKDNLLDWVRNAHAMEQQAETMLKGQASRLEHYPELLQRIEQHIVETQGQRELLEGCLETMGSSPSAVKDAVGKMMAMAQAVGGMMATDEVVKGAIAGYVFEQAEIATYRALMSAAEVAGETHVVEVARRILVQEEAMAAWLDSHLPDVVRTFLMRDATEGVPARR